MENTNETKYVACIGSRSLAANDAAMGIMFAVGAYLAIKGWVVKTGAAVGADQAFADGALSVGGKVILYIPWGDYKDKDTGEVKGYNRGWVNSAMRRGAVVVTYKHWEHQAAAEYAKDFPKKGKALFARNHLIMHDNRADSEYDRTVSRVVVWQENDSRGTAKALEIAANMVNPPHVFFLNNPDTLRAVMEQVFPPEVRALMAAGFTSEYPVD